MNWLMGWVIQSVERATEEQSQRRVEMAAVLERFETYLRERQQQ